MATVNLPVLSFGGAALTMLPMSMTNFPGYDLLFSVGTVLIILQLVRIVWISWKSSMVVVVHE